MKNSVNSVGRGLVGLVLVLMVSGAGANNMGENTVWGFPTTVDKTNKTTTLDQIQKQKGGYYDAIKPVYNYTTYIDRQYNCSVTSNTNANTGTNSNGATNSSPSVSNGGTTTADAAANTASNTVPQNGIGGVLVSGSYPAAGSSLNSNQANSGSLTSSVTGSSTSASTGPVSAGTGTSTQALNSNQSNSGALSASIAGSTACSGPFN